MARWKEHLWAESLDPSLVESHLEGSFEPCDHQLNTSSLSHWEMPLLGRRDPEQGASCGVQSVLWDLQWGWWGKSLPRAQQWLQKEGLLRQFGGKGNPAMKRNHILQEWDWTCPSSLNKSFSEFHPISSVWNFCSGFGETGIKGHDIRWCIIHWVLCGETLTCEPSAEQRVGMQVHNSKFFCFFFFFIWRPLPPLFVCPHQWLVNNMRRH